jgi:hypothetical protein
VYGVLFKDGVLPIAKLAPAGVRILGVLDALARRLQYTIVVTCADKEHGPADPHSLGEAFDIRTHDMSDDAKQALFHELMIELADDPIADAPKVLTTVNMPNLATTRFYAQIEHAGQPNEHLHVQRRNNTVYMPVAA